MFYRNILQLTINFKNNFILTADINGIERWEQILGIIANPLIEDIEFRRWRVQNRLSMQPPLTKRFLQQVLDELVGENNTEIEVFYNDYILNVKLALSQELYLQDIQILLRRLIPANMRLNIIILFNLWGKWYPDGQFTWGQLKHLTWWDIKRNDWFPPPEPTGFLWQELETLPWNDLQSYTWNEIEGV